MPFGKRQPMGSRGQERRREVREETDIAAEILLPTGHVIKCRVTDFTRRGARLAVGSAFGIPIAFELRAGGRTHRVTIVRRGTGHVGVVFVDPLDRPRR